MLNLNLVLIVNETGRNLGILSITAYCIITVYYQWTLGSSYKELGIKPTEKNYPKLKCLFDIFLLYILPNWNKE